MDKPCILLCNVLNELDRVETVESCCGHLKSSYSIWFHCRDFVSLAIIARAIDKRYTGTKYIWKVEAVSGDAYPTYSFMLYCPDIHLSEEEMMVDVEKICENIEYWKNNYLYYFKTNNGYN